MKKIIKYRRLCAILLLIVLMFSNAHVYAKITDKPNEVAGLGTSEDPYIIAISGGSGGKVVLKPEKVPFYFKVTGTGGVGGVFAIDYDTDSGLVSFQMVETVSVTNIGETSASVDVENTNYSNEWYQLGITANGVEEIEQSKYKIIEMYTQVFFTGHWSFLPYPSGASKVDSLDSNGYSVATRSIELTNVNSNITSGASYSKSDLYFLAKDIQTFEDLTSFYAASGYQYIEDDVVDITSWLFEDKHPNSNGFAYDIKIPNDETLEKEDKVTLMYKFDGLNNTSLGDKSGGLDLEALLARIFMAFGDILLDMIQWIFGKDLTINALIFNTYNDTKLNFYSSNASGVSSKLAGVVNTWYEIFSKLAYLLYVIILVYIGIMIIVTAGTGDQDKRKKSLGDWFAGLVIMFAVPTFVLPSLIKINDAFVKFMYNKNSEEVTTYYNYYDVGTDILGGDSATLSIEELMQMKEETTNELNVLTETQRKTLDDLIRKMIEEAGPGSLSDIKRAEVIEDMFKAILTRIKNYVSGGTTSKRYATLDECIKATTDLAYQMVIVNMPDNKFRDVLLAQCVPGASGFETTVKLLKEIAETEQQIDVIDKLIEVKQTDLMTIMRAYAGEYNRMVFVIVWFLLIFQMVAMVFIYYKRIFVIAILITIFPLIMIFYCIDKMADGSAQTLSMWFKEVISDIFIQSIHCVMYVVLVQMGLEIYKNDSNNWFLFLAAMLLLVPAERMMKEIFGLNSSTLGQLGGMGMNIAMGIGAAVKLGKMGLKKTGNLLVGNKDKAFIQKQNARFDKLQKKQTRADTRAAIRQNRRLARGKAPSKQRLHHLATNIRTAQAKVLPVAAKLGKAAKDAVTTTAAIGYGAYSAISGGGMASLYSGISMAEKASGVNAPKVSDKKAIIKTELDSAYRRQAAKQATANATTTTGSGANGATSTTTSTSTNANANNSTSSTSSNP